jgi:hypothetical protein
MIICSSIDRGARRDQSAQAQVGAHRLVVAQAQSGPQAQSAPQPQPRSSDVALVSGMSWESFSSM